MRSRQCGWIMPQEDIPSMLRMIKEKITLSEIEFEHQHGLIRLRDILEADLETKNTPERMHGTSRSIREEYEALRRPHHE